MLEINAIIKMDEGETIECPCCSRTHKIKMEEIAVTVGTCEVCEMEIIVEVAERTVGSQQ